MNISKNGTKLFFLFVLMLLIQISGRSQSCNLQINVFENFSGDYPQSKPIKNVALTLVDLSDNKLLKPLSVKGKFIFSEIGEGEYNLVASRKDFFSTRKTINLNCKLTNAENVWEEIVFLLPRSQAESIFLQKTGAGDTLTMWQLDLKIAGEDTPAIPLPHNLKDSGADLSNFAISEIALNERAIYLPKPVFSSEAIKNIETATREFIVFSAQVEIDEKGNVVKANVSGEFSRVIAETAKKAKFIPFYIKGKPARAIGIIDYVYSIKSRKFL